MIFALWMICLVIFRIFAQRKPIFYEAISQSDVSEDYQSTFPIIRILFEPIIGSTFAVGQWGAAWIGFTAILYIILRSIYLLRDKFGKPSVNCEHPIFIRLKLALDAYFKQMLIVFLALLVEFLFIYFVLGYLVIANNFKISLIIFFYVSFLLLVLDIVLQFVFKNKFTHTQSKPTILYRIQKWFNLHQEEKIIQNNDKTTLTKNIWKFSKKELKNFALCLFILMVLNQNLVRLHLPTQYLSTDLSPNEFLFDFHVHTSTSDGSLSPRDRVDWYIDQGINGAAFSDHHHPYGSQIAQEYVDRKNLDFTILLSQEFTDDAEDIHLNIYGIDIPLTPANYTTGSYSPNTMTCEEAIGWVKDQGGYVTVNHYSGEGAHPFTYEQLRDWGVDGFEIINGDDLRSPEIREFCLANNLICMAGTDEHGNQELTTVVKLYLPDPSNKSLDAIFTALRNNTHEAVLITQYPERVSLSSDFTERFINYQLGLTWGQSISWFIWTILMYTMIICSLEKLGKHNELTF